MCVYVQQAACPRWPLSYPFALPSKPWSASISEYLGWDAARPRSTQQALRPIKKARAVRRKMAGPSTPPIEMEEKELFKLPDDLQSKSAQQYAAESAEIEYKKNEAPFKLELEQIPVNEDPTSWLDTDITMPLRDAGELDLSIPPLPVSPLQTPWEFSEPLSPTADEMALDPLGGDESLASGENEEKTQSADEQSSFTLGRYLAGSEDALAAKHLGSDRSTTLPDFIRSTTPIDIQTELQRFDFDIGEVPDSMRLGDDINETLESECDEVDVVTRLFAGARVISAELDDWVSKSSLVGNNAKPLPVGSVDGRKRKVARADE
ncbi:hypothetical protein TWF696_009699 [Orbilia brochopaga]|uniref:Uncharacterized protein n=1 Tax=Orbilia brochopaga TaxID=3140254 RepID=A0AAV9UCY5_9PEZI